MSASDALGPQWPKSDVAVTATPEAGFTYHAARHPEAPAWLHVAYPAQSRLVWPHLDEVHSEQGHLDDHKTDKLQNAMLQRQELPNVTMVSKGGRLWAADGHHRLAAARRSKLPVIADVVQQ